jgi:tetrahydromethanopterin S-methyltransferase subunit G
MAEEPDNIVLKLLREIRDRLDRVEGKIDNLAVKSDGHAGLLVGPGKDIHDIDERVEHIEAKLGID